MITLLAQSRLALVQRSITLQAIIFPLVESGKAKHKTAKLFTQYTDHLESMAITLSDSDYDSLQLRNLIHSAEDINQDLSNWLALGETDPDNREEAEADIMIKFVMESTFDTLKALKDYRHLLKAVGDLPEAPENRC